MVFERLRSGGLLFAVLLRAVLLALLFTALILLLTRTQYYATSLVTLLCGALLIADLVMLISREHRAAERFLDALTGSALETPVQRSAVPASLRTAYDRALERLSQDRRRQQQQNEYLRTLVDTVPSALLVLDPDGTVELANRAAHRMLGETTRRLTELSTAGTVAASQIQQLPPGSHRIVQLADGRRLLASAARFATPDSPPRQLIALQRVAGDLDAVELKAWDDMARVLAHEMMNSLTPIASLSQSLDGLLRRNGPTGDVSAALETITRRSQGLLRFVERYRKVADLPDPQWQLLSVRTLIGHVERLVRPALEERAITLHIRCAPADLAVHADPDLLEQALINLLRNAAEAVAGTSQPVIRLECGSDRGRCVIDIHDNGPGLTAVQREQIFVPFFTTKPGGSGIGLPLARRIAQSHGGGITVLDSQPHGSIFRLSFPATAPDPVATDPHRPP